ncbi:hypothetical protein J4460_04875 [Candidatus Woesearchaeota archaeon]|nr:hypothetical protein [Candidatus Woesearchaeota archaeon]HIH37389.1 hypothetical protein [Candidatus Woesearchaeota archaeon]HIH48390.1 hypothetical protein [Candidatus Woesearchaeota archaeon]HIJ04229.1 hypothetical protein [Candidatus Woesearchaeota archaeon]
METRTITWQFRCDEGARFSRNGDSVDIVVRDIEKEDQTRSCTLEIRGSHTEDFYLETGDEAFEYAVLPCLICVQMLSPERSLKGKRVLLKMTFDNDYTVDPRRRYGT